LPLTSTRALPPDLLPPDASWRRVALVAIALAALSYAAAKLGSWFVVESWVSAFWPLSGVAAAALLVAAPRHWPGLLAAVYGGLLASLPPTLSVNWVTPVGNLIEPVAIAAVLRWLRFDRRLPKLRDAVSLVAVGAVATMLNVFLQFGLRSALLPEEMGQASAEVMVRGFWVGNFTGLMVVAPLVVAWVDPAVVRYRRREWIELGLTLLVALAALWLVFGEAPGPESRFGPLSYLVLPPVWWAALRLGMRGAFVVLLLTVCATGFATVAGYGPFAVGEPGVRVGQLQSFVGVAAVCVLLLLALTAERDEAMRSLSAHEEELRAQIQAMQAAERDRASLNERLGLALDVARMATWTWDVAANRLEWTGNLDRTLGISPGTFDGTFAGFLNLLGPEDRAQVCALNDECVRGERSSFELELGLQLPDGERRWINCAARTYRDERGKAARMVGTLSDITKRRRAEEARRAEAERLGIILGSLREAVYAIDPAGQVLFVTPSIERISGWTAEQLVGHSILDFVVPDDREIARAEFAKVFVRPDDSRPAEFRLRRPDGSECWISASSQLLVREEGPPIVTGVITDVAEARAARRAWRESEERMRAILEASVTAVAVVSTATGRIVYANRQAEYLLGAEPGSLHELPHDDPGWEILDLDNLPIPPERLPYLLVLRGGAPVYDVRHRLQRRDGRWIVVSVNGAPLRDERGEVTGVVFSIMDITASLATEQEIRALNADLEARVRERTEELQRIVNAMAGREVRMAELKAENERLRAQLQHGAAL
jgi:PAS domain S-box-containing protein